MCERPGRRQSHVCHWLEDPRLSEFDEEGALLTPYVGSTSYSGVGSWEEEREQLVGVIRHLVLEVRELFERLAEHEDDHFHRRV